MRQLISIFPWLLIHHFIFCQSITGSVSGDGHPLAFANVVLLNAEYDFVDGQVTDLHGQFEFLEYDKRAKYITASFIGFNNSDSLEIKDLNLDQLDISLDANPNVIACPIIKTYPYHYFSTIEPDVISIKGSHPGLAATFNDPTRSLIRYPGFSAANDEANNYSYRGMPSEFFSWRMDGAEIVNPNHLSNAGTISDRPSANAGGVMMIPFEALDEFAFHGTTYSKSFNNAIAGLNDIRPVKHAIGKSSFLKFGFLGLEAGFAHHHESKKLFAIHDIYAQYRYSFTGLLADFGVDFDGEEIKYQDAFLRVKLLSKGAYSLYTTFSYGKSENNEINLGSYRSDNLITGISLLKDGGFGTNDLELSLFYSERDEERLARNYPIDLLSPSPIPVPQNYREDYQPSKIEKLSLHLKSKIISFENSKFNLNVNSSYDQGNYYWASTYLSGFETTGSYYYQGNGQGHYGSIGLSLISTLNKFDLEVEANNSYTETEHFIPEGRLALKFHPSNQWRINLSIAKSSQLANRYLRALYQEPIVYGFVTPIILTNDLKSIKSLASNFGIEYKSESLNLPLNLAINLFYQKLFDVPVSIDENIFDPYTGIDFIYPTFLVSEGEANNYGLEFRSHIQLVSQIHIDLNGSVFNNSYSLRDKKITKDSPFNYNYVVNALVTKRFFFGQKVLFGSLAFHLRDRSLFPTINLEASREHGLSIYNTDFEKQGEIFHRLDLRLRYEFGKNHLILDIQNVMNRKNSSFTYYNPINDQIEFKEQLGMIPVFSYKRLF